jgi:eukaryotic-like serine/threonine-protein kinase
MNDDAPRRSDQAGNRDDRLNAAIAAYLHARDEGRPLDRGTILAQEPDLADELNRFFDSDDQVGWLITSVVPAVAAEGAWFGKYRVLRTIGRGGMGVVYEAEGPAIGQRVALKVLPTLGLPDPHDHERFRREIELAFRLDHPQIVPILDFGSFGGIPFCTMELIDGYDLRRVIRLLRRKDHPARADGLDLSNPKPVCEEVFQAIGLPEPGLSAEDLPGYLRFVASVGVQAGRALAYAHGKGISHRDIKPSNLLLDTQGKIHITDFGLAKAAESPDLTVTGDLGGTLRYMAPERLDGWSDPRSDVYSLGLTLYELLLLRPAFESIDRSRLINAITREAPRRPRSVNRAIPRDLELIIQRAIEKEPGHRYPTAAALADDLERFLAGRQIVGRPVALWRRAWAWSRRNRGPAGAIAAGFAVLFLAVSGLLFGLLMSRAAAEARAREAHAQRALAETARRESEYQSLLLQLQQTRLLSRSERWSEHAWELVRQAATIRADAGLRNQAAEALAGLDCRVVRHLAGTGASSVTFDRQGTRLLAGGIEPDATQDGRARALDLTSEQFLPVSFGLVGPGPVSFRDDGTPLQLVAQPGKGVVLWDLDHARAVAQLELPQGATATCLALRRDGSSVAASIATTDGRGQVLVWDVASRRVLQQFAVKARALAYSDDGELFVSGDEDGGIIVWKLPEGEQIAAFSQGRNTIESFSLIRNPHRDSEGKQAWLLAAGDSGGLILVWDLSTGQPISRCHGADYNVGAVAFSPDGATLVSAGRTGTTVIWDWANGRNLLSLHSGGLKSSVAFSHDGKKLATGHYSQLDPALSHVRVWELDQGRGIVTLRGLTGPVQWVLFAPDGRKLAALSQDWRLAIWDLPQRRLEAILNAPKGYSADNAALAFSSDGRQLAACAGREAKLWDVASKTILQTLRLPPGLGDRIAFPSSGELLLFRYESRDGLHVPIGDSLKISPIVCRIRNMLATQPLKPIVEFQGFKRSLVAAAIPGRPHFLIEDWRDGPGGRYQQLQALDAVSGKVLWSQRFENEDAGALLVDPTGELVTIGPRENGRQRPTLREALTGNVVLSFARRPGSPAPGGKSFICQVPEQPGVSVQNGDGRILLALGIDQRIASTPIFSTDGKRVAWGNANGSVMVADLDEIQSRLAQAGLSW